MHPKMAKKFPEKRLPVLYGFLLVLFGVWIVRNALILPTASPPLPISSTRIDSSPYDGDILKSLVDEKAIGKIEGLASSPKIVVCVVLSVTDLDFLSNIAISWPDSISALIVLQSSSDIGIVRESALFSSSLDAIDSSSSSKIVWQFHFIDSSSRKSGDELYTELVKRVLDVVPKDIFALYLPCGTEIGSSISLHRNLLAFSGMISKHREERVLVLPRLTGWKPGLPVADIRFETVISAHFHPPSSQSRKTNSRPETLGDDLCPESGRYWDNLDILPFRCGCAPIFQNSVLVGNPLVLSRVISLQSSNVQNLDLKKSSVDPFIVPSAFVVEGVRKSSLPSCLLPSSPSSPSPRSKEDLENVPSSVSSTFVSSASLSRIYSTVLSSASFFYPPLPSVSSISSSSSSRLYLSVVVIVDESYASGAIDLLVESLLVPSYTWVEYLMIISCSDYSSPECPHDRLQSSLASKSTKRNDPRPRVSVVLRPSVPNFNPGNSICYGLLQARGTFVLLLREGSFLLRNSLGNVAKFVAQLVAQTPDKPVARISTFSLYFDFSSGHFLDSSSSPTRGQFFFNRTLVMESLGFPLDRISSRSPPLYWPSSLVIEEYERRIDDVFCRWDDGKTQCVDSNLVITLDATYFFGISTPITATASFIRKSLAIMMSQGIGGESTYFSSTNAPNSIVGYPSPRFVQSMLSDLDEVESAGDGGDSIGIALLLPSAWNSFSSSSSIRSESWKRISSVVTFLLPRVDRIVLVGQGGVPSDVRSLTPKLWDSPRISVLSSKISTSDSNDDEYLFPFAIPKGFSGYWVLMDSRLDFPSEYLPRMISFVDNYHRRAILGIEGYEFAKSGGGGSSVHVRRASYAYRHDIAVSSLSLSTMVLHTDVFRNIEWLSYADEALERMVPSGEMPRSETMLEVALGGGAKSRGIPMISISRPKKWILSSEDYDRHVDEDFGSDDGNVDEDNVAIEVVLDMISKFKLDVPWSKSDETYKSMKRILSGIPSEVLSSHGIDMKEMFSG